MIKLGMIGCGRMGGAHMRRFHTLSNRVALTAAVDVVPERAEAVAQQFPGACVATDYREILDSVDAVLLALPHHLHSSSPLQGFQWLNIVSDLRVPLQFCVMNSTFSWNKWIYGNSCL